MESSELAKLALNARKNSYAPYSNYRVGAAILCEDGEVFTGGNIENASYPATVCAERTAVYSAIASGKRRFKAIAIAGGADDEEDVMSDYAYPCGICRQVLREFTDPETFKVYVARSGSDIKSFTLAELLPNSFGPGNLDR